MSEETNDRPEVPADIRKKLIKVQGNRDYLPVAARLTWFRKVHPNHGIVTEILQHEPNPGWALCRAEIRTPEGFVLATGMKMEDRKGFPDYLEKSEKGAVGRALGMLGFGTDDIGEDDGERVCDAPVNRNANQGRTTRNAPPGTPRAPQEARETSAAQSGGSDLIKAQKIFYSDAKLAGFPVSKPGTSGKEIADGENLFDLAGKVLVWAGKCKHLIDADKHKTEVWIDAADNLADYKAATDSAADQNAVDGNEALS